MVTSEVFQPAALGGGAGVAVSTGGVLSSLTVTVVSALFVAWSVALPVTMVLPPSTLTLTGSVHVATPELSSAQVNVTVTSLLFQPAALGAGVMLPMMVGFVRSMFTVTFLGVLLPAASVATTWMSCDGVEFSAMPAEVKLVPCTGTPAPSTVTVTGEASTTVPITTALAALVNPPSAGCVMVSCGG